MLKHPVMALNLFAMSRTGPGRAFFGPRAYIDSSAVAELVFGELRGNFKLWVTCHAEMQLESARRLIFCDYFDVKFT